MTTHELASIAVGKRDEKRSKKASGVALESPNDALGRYGHMAVRIGQSECTVGMRLYNGIPG